MSDSSFVVIAYTLGLIDPVLIIAGAPVTFFPDPDGSAAMLAEVTPEQAAFVNGIQGFSRWEPVVPGVIPDNTWPKMGILEWAQKNMNLDLDPKTTKADMLAAIVAAQGGAPAQPAADPQTNSPEAEG